MVYIGIKLLGALHKNTSECHKTKLCLNQISFDGYFYSSNNVIYIFNS